MARRAFCVIKKRWVFEIQNLRFWNLDFRKSKFAILKFGFSKIGNFDFRKLNFSSAFVTAKNSKPGWSFSDAFARKKMRGTHRHTHTHTQTHAHHQFWGSSTQKALRAINLQKIILMQVLIFRNLENQNPHKYNFSLINFNFQLIN